MSFLVVHVYSFHLANSELDYRGAEHLIFVRKRNHDLGSLLRVYTLHCLERKHCLTQCFFEPIDQGDLAGGELLVSRKRKKKNPGRTGIAGSAAQRWTGDFCV